jgi:uncharacterized protein YoxC
MEEYPIAELRSFIASTFNDEEIDVLCFDNFPDLYDNLPITFTKNQKVMRLLGYCRDRELIPRLLIILESSRGPQFRNKFPSFAINNDEHPNSPQMDVELFEESEEIGFLDVLDDFETHSITLQETAKRITDAITDVGKDVTIAADELNELGERTSKPSRSSAKRALVRASERIDVFTRRIEADTPLFARSLKGAISSIEKAIELMDDFPDRREKQVQELLQQLDILDQAIKEAEPQLQSFRNTVITLPRMVKELNQSKRQAGRAIEHFLEAFSDARSLVSTIRDAIT